MPIMFEPSQRAKVMYPPIQPSQFGFHLQRNVDVLTAVDLGQSWRRGETPKFQKLCNGRKNITLITIYVAF